VARRIFRTVLQVRHAQHAGSWPQDHRDPFDRMLAAQSLLEGLPLVTADPLMETFDIPIVW
jgi:PIN domain nuclease of toxin-antitoxin system